MQFATKEMEKLHKYWIFLAQLLHTCNIITENFLKASKGLRDMICWTIFHYCMLYKYDVTMSNSFDASQTSTKNLEKN